MYVGPADLSLTLGCTPKLDQTEPPVVEALGKILAACKRHKVIAGLHNATSRLRAQDGRARAGSSSPSRATAGSSLAKAAEEAAAVKQTVASGKLPRLLGRGRSRPAPLGRDGAPARPGTDVTGMADQASTRSSWFAMPLGAGVDARTSPIAPAASRR